MYPYHPLPLVRPTRSDAKAIAESRRKAKEIIDLTHETSKSSLTRPEDILIEQPLTEIISRNGVDRSTTLNNKHVLWFPPAKKKTNTNKCKETKQPSGSSGSVNNKKVTNKRKETNQRVNVGSSDSLNSKVSASSGPSKRMKKDAHAPWPCLRQLK